MGLAAGAQVTALLVSLVGAVLHPVLPGAAGWWILGAAATLILPAEAGLYSLRLPQAARLVPQWVVHEGTGGAFQFGVEMGTGFRTYAPSGLAHLALAALLLHPDFVAAALTGGGFAVGRILMTVSRTGSRDPSAWDADLAGSAGRIRRTLAGAAALALVVVAGVMPTVTFGG